MVRFLVFVQYVFFRVVFLFKKKSASFFFNYVILSLNRSFFFFKIDILKTAYFMIYFVFSQMERTRNLPFLFAIQFKSASFLGSKNSHLNKNVDTNKRSKKKIQPRNQTEQSTKKLAKFVIFNFFVKDKKLCHFDFVTTVNHLLTTSTKKAKNDNPRVLFIVCNHERYVF